jgi:hypothetical protein
MGFFTFFSRQQASPFFLIFQPRCASRGTCGEPGQRGDPDRISHALRASFFTAEQLLQCSEHHIEGSSLGLPKLPAITVSH